MKLGGIGEDVYLWHKTYESWTEVAKKIELWHFNHVQLFFVFPDQYRPPNTPTNQSEQVHSIVNIPELETVLNTIYAKGAQAILNCTHDHSPTFFNSQLWINDWVALAQRYKGDPRVQAFNVFDEPCGKGEWGGPSNPDWAGISAALVTCINAIRAVDPSRKIMLPFCSWSVPKFSAALMNLGNLIVSLHIWHDWIRDANGNSTGVPYDPVTTAQGHILLAQQFQNFANQYGADTYLEYGSSVGAPTGITYVTLMLNACVANSISFDLFMYADSVWMGGGSWMDTALANSNYTEPENYVLDVWAVDGGITTPTGTQTVPSETVITIAAVPSQGYMFGGWLVNNVSHPATENPLTLTITAATTVIPIFNLIQPSMANVTITVMGQGTTNPALGNYVNIYNIGSSLYITATPTTGWQYQKMRRNGIDHTTANPGEFLNLAATENIEVVFTQALLEIHAFLDGTETVALAEVVGIGSYPTPVTLPLAPGTYTVNCSLGTESQTEQATLTSGQTTRLDFQFTTIVPPPALTITAVNGTTNPPAGTYEEAQDSQVTVTVTPNAGYRFKEWLLDNVPVGTSPSYTVLMNASHSLVAVCEPAPPSHSGYTLAAMLISIPLLGKMLY